MKRKIPLCKLPPWESVPALRIECVKRCVNDNELGEVKRMNNETKLQHWLLSRCKSKYILCLCCHFLVEELTVTLCFLMSGRRMYINSAVGTWY